MTEWEEFKFELIDMKKKYQFLQESLTDDNLKLKETASEWALQYIAKGFREGNHIYICELAKIVTSYKRLARKRCKCCKESKKLNAKYNEK